ncbi:hypothetical protein BGX26_004615 [Mortierella sp. AD094]|nr:hypothetical protein BGX26_004615 [Mortierella sp. AD094]
MEDYSYYYTGQTPFRKPNESTLHFHARRLISIQTLGRLEYNVEEAESKFNRALGPIELTFVGLGSAAANQAGPSVTISFLLGGFVSGIAALSYAEMASMIPIAGSAYTYAYASLGELAAWIIGWDLILEYLIGAATVSVGWSSYMIVFLKDAFGWEVSQKWTNTPIKWDGNTFSRTGDCFNAPAFFISAVVSITLFFGIHMTAKINNYLVVFKVIVLLILIFAMIPFIKTENYHPYIPESTGGVSGMLAGASTVFFAYIGFDSISTTAQEAKEPQVNLPVGIMATIIIATVLYVGVSIVTVGVDNYVNLGGSSPVVDAVRLTGMHWLVVLTELGALAATTSVILVLLISQPRVFYAMANDGLIPRVFAKVHPKYKTPYVSTIVTGVICAICGAVLPIDVLSDISSVGTIFTYFVVNIGVIILRYTRKTVPRRFKVPGGPFLLPGIGAGSSLLLLKNAKQEAIIRLLVWMAIGFLVYALYGRTHSEINNPRMTVDEPMQVIHENYSVNSFHYQGYTDDDLRQQHARQQARRMDYDRPMTQRYSDYIDSQPPSEHGAGELNHPDEHDPTNRASPLDDGASSCGGIDSGHGVGIAISIHRSRGENVSVTDQENIKSDNKELSESSPHSFRQPQPSFEPYPEMAHIS